MDCNNYYNSSQKLPISSCFSHEEYVSQGTRFSYLRVFTVTGADPGFFLGGGTPVSCCTSTPINHIVFLGGQNTSCIRKLQVISGGLCTPCTLPLDPPLCKLCFLAVCNTTKNKSAGISQTKSKGTTL